MLRWCSTGRQIGRIRVDLHAHNYFVCIIEMAQVSGDSLHKGSSSLIFEVIFRFFYTRKAQMLQKCRLALVWFSSVTILTGLPWYFMLADNGIQIIIGYTNTLSLWFPMVNFTFSFSIVTAIEYVVLSSIVVQSFAQEGECCFALSTKHHWCDSIIFADVVLVRV